MVLAILDGVVLRIGLSRLFGIVFEMGFFGFVLGYALAAYGYAIPSLIYFLSGIWRKLPSLAQKL
jgi:Na+-driven multidrug efflux pump